MISGSNGLSCVLCLLLTATLAQADNERAGHQGKGSTLQRSTAKPGKQEAEALPPGVVARLGSRHMQHRSSFGPAGFSPDGKTLASVDYGNLVRFWDTATGKEVARLPGGILKVAYAPDGKSLYVLGDDGVIRQLDAVTHKELRRFSSLGFPQLILSPNGKWLATGCGARALQEGEKSVLLWDTATGKAVRVVTLPNDDQLDFVFSPDGKLLAGVSLEEGIAVADVATGKIIRRLRIPPGVENKKKAIANAFLMAPAFGPDGKTVACLSSIGHLCLFDVASGKQLRQLTVPQEENLDCLAFSPDGKKVALGGSSATAVYLYNLTTGKGQALKPSNRNLGIQHLFFSPDGKRLAAVDFSGWIQLWDTATNKLPAAFERKSPPISRAVLSPDGKLAVTWSECGPPRVWETRTGKDLGPLADEKMIVRQVVFSPNGKELYTLENYWVVRLWDVGSRKELRNLDKQCWPLRFSPDGKFLITQGWRYLLQMVDIATGKMVRELQGPEDRLEKAVISPDGKLMAFTTMNRSFYYWIRTVCIWDLATGKQRFRTSLPRSCELAFDLTFTPDGKELLFVGEAHGVRRWDVASGKELPSLLMKTGDQPLFSADGSMLLGFNEKSLIIHRLNTGQQWVRAVENGSWTLSNDGKTLLSIQEDGSAQVWDVADLIARGQPPRVPEKMPVALTPSLKRSDPLGGLLAEGAVARLGPTPWLYPTGISSIAFSREGKSFVLGPQKGGETPLVLYDVATGKVVRRFGNDTYLHGLVAVSPNGKILALWSKSALELWDLATGKLLRRLPVILCEPTALAFSPDGSMVAAASVQGFHARKATIQRWQIATGQELKPLEGLDGRVYALAFAADGRKLFSVGDSSFAAWDAVTGNFLLPRIHYSFVNCQSGFAPDGSSLLVREDENLLLVPSLSPKKGKSLPGVSSSANAAFSADGKLLATGGERDPICLWEVATGKMLRSFAKLTTSGRAVLGFSPDAKLLATADHTGPHGGPTHVRFWEVATGKEIRPCEGHATAVTCLVHSPDGKLLASADWDGVVCLWDVPVRRLQSTLVGQEGSRVDALAFSVDGGTLVSASNTGIMLWDVAGGQPKSHWKIEKKASSTLALSHDGKTLVIGDDNGTVRCWEVVGGKRILTLDCEQWGGKGLRLSPAGSVLVTVGDDGLGLWSLPRGERLATIKVKERIGDNQDQQLPSEKWLDPLAFSPDGRLLAILDRRKEGEPEVQLWEVATARPICALTGIAPGPQVLTFSSDSKALLYSCWQDWVSGAVLRDISTFADLQQITGPGGNAVCLANGRILRPLRGHPTRLTCAAFDPAGKTVATASSDGTILLWKVAAFLQPLAQVAKLSEVERGQLWDQLTAKDAPSAFRASARLEGDPSATLNFLQKRLRPTSAPDPAQVARWIADLESNRFEVRSKAGVELEKLGELAEPALKKAAAKPASLELRRRLERLQEKLLQAHLEPEKLRGLRSVALLERVGTPAARKLLETLAGGTPEARITQEARSALARLLLQ